MRIIEFYTRNKIKSTEYNGERASTPSIGDVVQYQEADGQKTAVIEKVDKQKGSVTIVKGFYDPFMGDGYIDVSGGPFQSVPLDSLEPTMTTKPVRFWHWGDNLPGGGMGCHFYLDRPVFTLIHKTS